jgi:hypothetical protein
MLGWVGRVLMLIPLLPAAIRGLLDVVDVIRERVKKWRGKDGST